MTDEIPGLTPDERALLLGKREPKTNEEWKWLQENANSVVPTGAEGQGKMKVYQVATARPPLLVQKGTTHAAESVRDD